MKNKFIAITILNIIGFTCILLSVPKIDIKSWSMIIIASLSFGISGMISTFR